MPGSRWSPESSRVRCAGDHRQTWPSECPGVCTTCQVSPPITSSSPPRSRGGGLDDGVQVGQPPGEVVREVAALVLGHAVVGVRVAAAGAGGVGMAVLLAVQVRHRVHRQLGTGQLHQPPGQAVVVDVRVGDHDTADVGQRVARALEAGLEGGETAVGQVGPPHPAVDDGHPVPVRQDVAVHALDGVDPDRQDHPRDPAHSPHRPLLSRACVPAARTTPAARRGTRSWRRPPFRRSGRPRSP